MVKSANKSKVCKKKKNLPTGKKKLRKNLYINKDNSKLHNFILVIIIFLLGILLIFSTYAWLSTSLNVKIKNFNMIVSKNSGLSISLDGINYDSFVELSEDILINELKETYPNNISQWSNNGLTPVSSNGIKSVNDNKFLFFASGGVRYRNKKKENGYINITEMTEDTRNSFNYFLAFDLFLKNDSGSPENDFLYLGSGSYVRLDEESDDEMEGLVNSARIGFLRIGDVPLNSNVETIQNITCNNNCKSIIYEPNSKNHSKLSIERALKYNIDLRYGVEFPTYACMKPINRIEVKDCISGSPNLNYDYFKLQETITQDTLDDPIFELPNAITKMRVYVWLEGQDIDSLETDSKGASISISIDLTKDTAGYDAFN